MPLSALVLLLSVSFRYPEPYDNGEGGRIGSRCRFMITNRGGLDNTSACTSPISRGLQACIAQHPTMSIVNMGEGYITRLAVLPVKA